MVFAARKGIVGEGHIGTDENIVFNAQPVPQLNTRLNRNPVANDDIVFDKHMCADVAIGTNAGTGQDDNELPNAGVGADVGGLDIGERVQGRRH